MPASFSPPDINTMLPAELLYLIFKLLRGENLKQAVAVCRRWKGVGEAQNLWTWVQPRITQKNIKIAKDLLGCKRMQGVSKIMIAAISEDVLDGVARHQGLRSASISCGLLSLHERRLLVMLVGKLENVELMLAKDEVSNVLGEILSTTSSALKTLDLSRNNLNQLGEGLLGLAVATLEELKLQRTELTTKQLREILASVVSAGSRCKMKKLDLSENNFSGVEASLMEIFPNVEEVELENTSLTGQQLAVILSCLAVSSKTKKLNLNQNCLSSIEPALVARLTMLEEARLADCQLSPQQLGALLQGTGCLRKLDISGHSFKTIEVASLSFGRAAGHLEELRASRCQFSQESLEAIFDKIVGGCRLKKLDLSHVSLTSVNSGLLAKMARLLVELLVPHTFLTSIQVEEIFEAIKGQDSRLRVLHISCNRLFSVEPETLSSAVARLYEVRMERCSLSSPQVHLNNYGSVKQKASGQVQALLNAAAQSSSLVSLHMGQEKFFDRNLVQKARRNVRDLF